MSCNSSHAHPWPGKAARQPVAPVVVYIVVLICMGYLVHLGYEAMTAISVAVAAGLGAAEIVRRLGAVAT